VFDPAAYHATETLNDGRKVENRAQQPGDREGLRAAVRRASTKTFNINHPRPHAKMRGLPRSSLARCIDRYQCFCLHGYVVTANAQTANHLRPEIAGASKLIFEPNPTIVLEPMPRGPLSIPHDK